MAYAEQLTVEDNQEHNALNQCCRVGVGRRSRESRRISWGVGVRVKKKILPELEVGVRVEKKIFPETGVGVRVENVCSTPDSQWCTKSD